MQNANNTNNRRNRVRSGARRIAILASVGGLVLAALALPVSVEGDGFVLSPAFGASENGNAGGKGKGKGPASAPGQQPTEDLVKSEAVGVDEEGSALADSIAEEPTLLPIAGNEPANTNVIKEIAGLAGDAELSEEEELEAIHSGWGTWRTADGPETVVAQ